MLKLLYTGASSEDVVHSGVKKKESCRREDTEGDTKSSPSKPTSTRSSAVSTEEKMDIDIDSSETATSEVPAEVTGAAANSSETASVATALTEGKA